MVSQTRNCARLLIIAVTPVHKAGVKLTEVKSHGNNVCDVIIAHVISANKQTNKQKWKCKAILGPVNPAGKNILQGSVYAISSTLP